MQHMSCEQFCLCRREIRDRPRFPHGYVLLTNHLQLLVFAGEIVVCPQKVPKRCDLFPWNWRISKIAKCSQMKR